MSRLPPPRLIGAWRRRRLVVAILLAGLLITGCDTGLDRTPTRTSTASGAPTTSTSVSITPVTPDGFLTGPGVTDSSITLGLLVDPERDRGFSTGVELWRQAVNTSGGVCGRTVELIRNGSGGIPADVVDAYDSAARSALGLITLPSATASAALNSSIAADQMPTLTPTGTSAQLGPARPIVIGPTQDILAINGLEYLIQSGTLAAGSTLGVLTDGSALAENGLLGAQWWAANHDVTLDVRTVEAGADLVDSGGAGWGGAAAVLALTDPVETAELTRRTDPAVTILTTLDGYDPAGWDSSAVEATIAGRVLVSTATPAFGSDYPAAVAVASRAAAAGETQPGPRLLDGYATGVNWTRLLTEACGDQALTRTAVQQAISTVGPASIDSLYGATDPSLPVQSALPATRVSAMSVANPTAPTGLEPLTWLEAAADIEDYLP